MTEHGDPWPNQFVKNLSERTAVLERDVYHVDRTVKHLNGRLSALSDRVLTAENYIHGIIKNIEKVEHATETIRGLIPDAEAVLKRGWSWIRRKAMDVLIITGSLTLLTSVTQSDITGRDLIKLLTAFLNAAS